MLSVGEILKKQRETANIQLADVEKAIKVRQKFLRAVEENDWTNFSSKIYIAGIIKNYSNYLGLDSGTTLAFFRRDYARKEGTKFKSKLAIHIFTSETKKTTTAVLVLIFVLFFAYFGYQLKVYFTPPKLAIIEPKTNEIVKKDKIEIWGKTEKDAAVSIFGERVYQDKEGMFVYQFPLHPGKNELIIEVIGANGRKNVIKRIFQRTD